MVYQEGSSEEKVKKGSIEKRNESATSICKSLGVLLEVTTKTKLVTE